MSTPFYDLASLVVVPSGYKSGKVYAQKPQTTDGQLTFTRASSATRVASNGLIEKVRTNSALQSQTFENASWTKNAGATITANTTTAPDGTLTAETLNVATTIFSGLYQLFTTSTNSWTTSLFVKKGTKDFIYLFDPSTNLYAWFNLTTGAVGQKTASTEAAMISVGNGWYRISVTTAVAGNASHFIQFGLSDANGSFIPATTGTAFIWGAQAEVSDFGATDYIPTTTAAVSVGPVSGLPRLDYLNSTCPKLILEGQRTNLVTFSENFDNAAWTKSNSVVTANTSVSPDGYTNADTIVISATGYILQSFASYSAVSGQKITISIFAKNQTNGFLTFGGATPAGTDVYAIESYGNGWYRHCVVRTFTTTTTGTVQYIIGTVGTHIIWGAQVEGSNSAYATSYIPTLAASVTRVADAASKTGISSLIGQTEGTLFVEFAIKTVSEARRILCISDGSISNRVVLAIESSNQFRALITNGGVQQFSSLVSATDGRNKLAVSYKANDFSFYLNGVQVSTQLSGSVPLCSDVYLGKIETSSSSLFLADGISQALLFKTRLTNAQLAELTAL